MKTAAKQTAGNNNKKSWGVTLQSKKMEAIGSLASGLAHDFNNILTHIRSSTQLLMLSHDESSEDYETLKEIENEVIRGAELTKQLLLFSKPSEGRTGIISVNEHIRTIYKLLKRINPKNIRITLDLADVKTLIRIRPTEFEQILINLAINARDAMPEGGTLKIATSIVAWNQSTPGPVPNAKHGRYIQIDMADTGTGITSGALSKIFDPFYTSKGKNDGTGLGLTIVYAIVHRCKGHILVDSTPSVGTTITLFLPCRIAVQQKVQKEEAVKDKPLGGNETILIVDDEPLITKSTARFLERYGYHILTAFDGKAGLKLFKNHKNEVDVVLLDLELPKMDGFKCLEKMLITNPGIKVITLSAHFIKLTGQNPTEMGAKAFIQKPFDSNELLSTIRSILK